jgi:hypothetical protein
MSISAALNASSHSLTALSISACVLTWRSAKPRGRFVLHTAARCLSAVTTISAARPATWASHH